MAELILTTFDWVPEGPRGFVRDLRVRWALEEARLPYRVASVPFGNRNAEHFAHQPFGQVPWLTDGDISIFESGAILLHLGERSDALMPTDPRDRSAALEWLFAALNSVEAASQPWSLLKFTGNADDTPGYFTQPISTAVTGPITVSPRFEGIRSSPSRTGMRPAISSAAVCG